MKIIAGKESNGNRNLMIDGEDAETVSDGATYLREELPQLKMQLFPYVSLAALYFY